MGTVQGRVLAGVLAVSVLLLLTPAIAVAQLSTATILGTITDASGGVLPGTTVTARNLQTGQERTTVTGGDGSYRLTALPVGGYEVRAELQGFNTGVRSGLTLTVAQEAVVNFSLPIGEVSVAVTVLAEAPLVNTTNAAIGGLVDTAKIESLPLLGRNYIDLTLLQTGVTEHQNINRGTARVGTWFAANGATLRSNNYMLDGAMLQTLHGSGSASFANNTLGLDGIQEYRVLTSSFGAEYGMRMGSQTIMVSKAGTNIYHGTGFGFFRDESLNARNFFDAGGKPPFSRQNYGGAGGGPIKKDKVFVFGVFEKVRERKGLTNVSTTISAEARAAVPQINPAIKPLLDLYPLPNLPRNEYQFDFTRPTDEHYMQYRGDYNISDNDSIFGRFTFDENDVTDVGNFEPFESIGRSQAHYTTGSYTRVISPTLVNMARGSFSFTRVGIDAAPIGEGLIGPQFSLVPGKLLGTVSPGSGVSSLGYASTILFRQRILTLSDDLTQTLGAHSLKYGFLFNRLFPTVNVRVAELGAITFPNVNEFLAGRPSDTNAATPGSNFDRQYKYETYGFYLQDDIRLAPNFTLNAGLRYEFNTQPTERGGLESSIVDVETFSELTLGPVLQQSSLRDWSPRVGFAWDLFGNGRTAIRGGTALLYDIGWFNSNFAEGATAQPPFSSQSRVRNPGSLVLPLQFPPGTAGRVVRSNDFFSEQPKLWTFNVSVEQELPWSIGLAVAYAGSRGHNLAFTKEGNPRVPEILPDGRKFWAPGLPRRNPNWDDILFKTTGAKSWYDSLQVSVLKRLSNGLEFQSSYTWSEQESDEVIAQLNGDVQNTSNVFNPDPFDSDFNFGPLPWDIRHNWRFNATYHLPELGATGLKAALLNGWWVSTLTTAQTGVPFTPTIRTQRSRSGVGANGTNIDYPDVVPGIDPSDITKGVSRGCPGVPAGTPVGTPERWFDPCAFTIPEAGFLGTATRGLLRAPGFAQVNVSLAKDQRVAADHRLQFRLDIFNLFNRVNLSPPARQVFTGNQAVETPTSTVGRITSTIGGSRELQWSVRYSF